MFALLFTARYDAGRNGAWKKRTVSNLHPQLVGRVKRDRQKSAANRKNFAESRPTDTHQKFEP